MTPSKSKPKAGRAHAARTKTMGGELSKRYAVDEHPTGSGGHGYQWKKYDATRKKDGLEVSVFVFDKSALDKKLRGQKQLAAKVADVMRRDVATLARAREGSGGESRRRRGVGRGSSVARAARARTRPGRGGLPRRRSSRASTPNTSTACAPRRRGPVRYATP